MESEIKAITDEVISLVTLYGLDVIGAIVILLVGLFLAGRADKLLQRALSRSKRIDEMLRSFFGSLIKYVVIAITIIAVLNQFGVQTASLIAVVGAAGLAIGLALQGTLSNVAAGVMLLIFRPFKAGEFVEAGGHGGTVKSVGLFVTEMATPDNVQIIIPNSQVWGSSVVNYSHHDTRRLDLSLGIAYEDSIKDAKAAIEDLIASDPRCHKEPAPLVAVSNLGDSSVDFVIRIWCNASDYWPLKWDMIQALKERMDQEGISIPYPQRTIHTAQAG